jgi:hypothetical protein
MGVRIRGPTGRFSNDVFADAGGLNGRQLRPSDRRKSIIFRFKKKFCRGACLRRQNFDTLRRDVGGEDSYHHLMMPKFERRQDRALPLVM